eukprot:GHVS01026205.1.p1 GENE.GHVS01026205.1~~GHVS01026205.1.p1  ORF type:complete len:418 (+),score=65.58 GHVS01026205.1:318-1571(+)
MIQQVAGEPLLAPLHPPSFPYRPTFMGLKSTCSKLLVLAACLLVFILFVPLLLPHPRWFTTSSSTAFMSSTTQLLQSPCNGREYADRALKLTFEMSCLGWVANDDRKFEASDVVFVNDAFYVLADNAWQMLQFDTFIHPFNKRNKQIRPDANAHIPKADSSFEALVYDEEASVFYATREAIAQEDKTYVGEIWQLRMGGGETYEVLEKCDSEFEFSAENKGFEGMVLLKDSGGEVYLLGLCEGNYCKGGKDGRSKGNGRMVLMKKGLVTSHKEEKCIWQTVRVLNLPKEIAFEDYSSASMYGKALAITSQQESMLWIGEVNLDDDFRMSEADALEVQSGGSFYLFPRDNDCNVVYCNIEGISFINNRMLVAVSDQMKHGRQDFRCLQKDQSLHVFSLPAKADTPADNALLGDSKRLP